MKKVFLAIAVVAMIAMASCKKSNECKCKTTDPNGNVTTATHTLEEGQTCSQFEVSIAGYSVKCK